MVFENVARVAIWVLASATLSLSCVAIYRLYFHPLAKVPGPLFQRISGIPRMWHCYAGDRHLREMQAHQSYGSVVRIGPDSLAFSTLSALQTIHSKDSNVFKGNEFYGLLDGGAEGGRSVQMVADNTAHAARRRVVDKALPPRDQAFRDIDNLARKFVSSTVYIAGLNSPPDSKGWTGSVDLTTTSSWFSFDLISTVAFGDSMEMMTSEAYRWVPACLRSTSIFLYWAGYAPFLGFWQYLLGSKWPTRLGLHTVVNSQRYTELADEQLDKRIARLESGEEQGCAEKRTDLFKHLLQANLYGEYDLRADSSLLIAAGSDAIRLTVAATVFYWLKNPAVFEKAKQEIYSLARSSDDISDAKLSSMKYLRACIDETMRLCPPKASSLPREVLKDGITIDGIYVPKGMTVGTSVYALHHDPEIYPEPYAFRPERWLQPSPDRRMQAAFCPFLKGPRACPGKTVAYFAMQLALFHLVLQYDIRAAPGKPTGGGHSGPGFLRERDDEYQFNDWIIGFSEGPNVQLKPRD
ncbi:cytochrome P450 [Polychaeton citri CBS 116435]|uniref:Cytochrome P450 n=1 Tax=Polychaeton citri CBS 116435 TaxID=1314669 RepID=A0A9P4UMB0_9PEZI|nr:cytochrome P450 [Polychaeton citri CBS 116435]